MKPRKVATAAAWVQQDGPSRLLSNLMWNYVSGFAGVVGLLLLYPFAVRIAGAEAYGLWTLIFGAVQLMALADFGLGTGVVRTLGAMIGRQASIQQQRQFVNVSMALFMAVAIGMVVLATAAVEPFHSFVSVPPFLSGEFPFLAALAIVTLGSVILGRAAVSVLWATDRPDIERKWTLIGLALRTLITVLASRSRHPLLVIATGECLSALLPSAACFAVVKRRFKLSPPSWEDARQLAPALIKFSSVLFIGSFASIAASQLPLYVAGHSLGLTAASGYGALLRVYQSSRNLLSWTVNPFNASVSRTDGKGEESGALLLKVLSLSVGVSLLVSIPMIVMPEVLVRLWLGVPFLFVAVGLRLLGFVMVANAVILASSLFANILRSPVPPSILNMIWLVSTGALLFVFQDASNLTPLVWSVGLPLIVLCPVYLLLGYRAVTVRAKQLNGGLLAVSFAVLVALLAITMFLTTADLSDLARVATYGGCVCAVGLVAFIKKRLSAAFKNSGGRVHA